MPLTRTRGKLPALAGAAFAENAAATDRTPFDFDLSIFRSSDVTSGPDSGSCVIADETLGIAGSDNVGRLTRGNGLVGRGADERRVGLDWKLDDDQRSFAETAADIDRSTQCFHSVVQADQA